MMMLKALIVALVAVGAQASCEEGSSMSLVESGYKCASTIDGFCLACPPDEIGSTSYGATITCTCSGGEPCSVFNDGEPSTMEAFEAAITS